MKPSKTRLALLCCFIALFLGVSDAQASNAKQYTQLEAGELFPAGDASAKRSRGRQVLSQAATQLTLEQKLDFKVGQAIFEKIWVLAPSSTQASDGLGPLYNARSCNRCHTNNSRGKIEIVTKRGSRNISLFARLSIPAQTREQQSLLEANLIPFVPEPTYGAQFQNFAYPGGKAEGQLLVSYTKQPTRLRDNVEIDLNRPSYILDGLGYGPVHDDVMMSPRIAPPIHGLGLINAISSRDIMSNADPDDQDGDGISGRARISFDPETNATALGRFGWKAGAVTLSQQNMAALSNDIGIGSLLYPNPYGDCTTKQHECLKQPHGNTQSQDGLEASQKMTEALLYFVENISVPRRVPDQAISSLPGKKLFNAIGCASCHVPSFVTDINAKPRHLAGQSIWPYSDFLLHDLGEALADNRPEGNANGREWRTPPLWGIGLTRTATGAEFYLHDGRARSLTEAILWHGGEAERSKLSFKHLPAEERGMLINFLESL